ncbi:MAG: neutral zinc metallopeptidase, partial [Acidobacteria bacterium]|nr:neutral zinc metallopeptidase [Acidobacteriota bacterium]
MTKIRSNDSSMIDDRRGRGGGGGGGAGFPGMGGLGGMPAGMKAGGGVLGIIVTLAVLFLSGALGGDGSSSGGSTSAASGLGGTAAAESCTTDLEQTLCGSTIDVQQYWKTALPKYFNTPYRTTKTVFFSGRTNTGCGAATSQVGPFYCPADQLVYFDLDFLVALEKQYIGQSTDLAQQYIVAHEYGHHIQNVLGTSDQVRRLQKSKPSLANQYSVALELQADCYAGVWVGDVARRGLLDSKEEIKEALNAAAGVG